MPALHKKYLAAMLDMFGECAEHGARTIDKSAKVGAGHPPLSPCSQAALFTVLTRPHGGQTAWAMLRRGCLSCPTRSALNPAPAGRQAG